MKPSEVGQSYDKIAHRWQEMKNPQNGIAQHERALQFVKTNEYALDAGCGCSGRFIDLLAKHGFTVEGVDVSEKMIVLAKQRHPGIQFYNEDICEWILPRKYGFITGWDGIWHVPLEKHEGVLQKLCNGLTEGGVLIFTTGGIDVPGEKKDACMGPSMYTAAMGIPKTLSLLEQSGCVCRHLEYDQHPEFHLFIIAQKV